MDEKFKLNDLKAIKTKNGDTLFYIIIYSTLLEDIEKIYITSEDYEYLLKNQNNLDINKCLKRYYNAYKKKFAVKFSRI